MTRWFLVLPLLGCLACGERGSNAAGPSSGTFIQVEKPKGGWAQSIQYRTDADGVQLVLDGVRFELRDAAAYRLDWDAIGMAGIKVTSSLDYESNVPVEGALLAVGGKEVRIAEGTLEWGGEALGPVAEGDRVIVDADGLRID